MSDNKRYKGKLKIIPKLNNETLEEQCKNILINKFKKTPSELGNDEYFYQLEGQAYNEYTRCGNNLYEIIDLTELDPYDSFINIYSEKDGLAFETTFYNGGTYLSEMLNEGLENYTNDLNS